MRLREPFAGMRLSTGHFLIHIAFFIGSFLPMNIGVNKAYESMSKAENVMFALRCSHFIVPIFELTSFLLHI